MLRQTKGAGATKPPPAHGSAWLRAGAWVGLTAVFGDVALPHVIALWQPGYSHLAQYMSELAVPGKAGAQLLSAWWMASGVGFVAFAFTLHKSTSAGPAAWLGPLAIATYGIFTGVGSGAFPCDEGCVGATLSGRLHDELNAIGALTQLVAPGACWWRWRKTEEPPVFRRWTALAQGVLLLTFAAFIVMGEHTHGAPDSLAGLTQRLYQGSFYVWLSALALTLVRR